MGNTGVPGPSGASSSGFGEREASVTWAEPSVRGGGRPGTTLPSPAQQRRARCPCRRMRPAAGEAWGTRASALGCRAPPLLRGGPGRGPAPSTPRFLAGQVRSWSGWAGASCLPGGRGSRRGARGVGLGCSLRSRGQESLCEWAGPPDTEAAGPRVPRAAASLPDSPSGCPAQLPPTGLLGVAPQTHRAMVGGQEPSCWEPGLRGTAWGQAGASQEAAGTASVMPRTSPLSTAGQAPRQPLWGASPPSRLPQRMSRSARSCGNRQASRA